MSRLTDLAQLFTPEPSQWGLRGDPYLWRELRETLAGQAWPATADELEALLVTSIEAQIGAPLAGEAPIFVQRFSHGGMSSGLVDPRFWRATALPLLRARYLGA
jgi:hypothetical protein